MFLSELADKEDILLRVVQHAFACNQCIENDYGEPAILKLFQVAKKVHREKHRMEAFVRFQRTKDDLYFAFIEPDFNVLPIITKHFENRYGDQNWMIYDKRRSYGIYYDRVRHDVTEVQVCESEPPDRSSAGDIFHEDEPMYQMLWQTYFKSVNIVARNNKKLHLRHIPTRYWKYLTEKFTF